MTAELNDLRMAHDQTTIDARDYRDHVMTLEATISTLRECCRDNDAQIALLQASASDAVAPTGAVGSGSTEQKQVHEMGAQVGASQSLGYQGAATRFRESVPGQPVGATGEGRARPKGVCYSSLRPYQ